MLNPEQLNSHIGPTDTLDRLIIFVRAMYLNSIRGDGNVLFDTDTLGVMLNDLKNIKNGTT